MERLTIYDKLTNSYVKRDEPDLHIRSAFISIMNKLGKLEDIMDKYKVKDLEELKFMIEAYMDERGEY